MTRLSELNQYYLQGDGTAMRTPFVAPPIVEDTFTDTDLTALAAHTPDIDTVGGGWSGGGNASIDSNQLLWGAGTINQIDSGISDFTLTCDLFYPSGNYVDLPFRISGSNYLMVEIGHTPYNVLKLYQMPGATLLGTGTTALGPSTMHSVKVVCSGTSIKVSVNGGADEIDIASSWQQTATEHGIKCYTGGCRHDNFKVESL